MKVIGGPKVSVPGSKITHDGGFRIAPSRYVGRPPSPSITEKNLLTGGFRYVARATVSGRRKKRSFRSRAEAESRIELWCGEKPLPLLATRLSPVLLRESESAESIYAKLKLPDLPSLLRAKIVSTGTFILSSFRSFGNCRCGYQHSPHQCAKLVLSINADATGTDRLRALNHALPF